MKRIQGKNIVGYVTIHVKGNRPELFFQVCADANIPVWDIRKTGDSECSGKIYLVHLAKMENLAKNYPYEMEITERKGYINYFSRLWKRKELLFSIILCGAILFFLSNIIWKVEINGVSAEIEDKLNKSLSAYGLYEGAWMYSMAPLDVVQQQILHELPELLYIGIEKKGTTYTVDAIEKLIEKEKETSPNQHLVATKSGIVQKMFVKKGTPAVHVNDFVKKGDILVSGILEEENEDEQEESETKDIITSAEGKVYANTWYEVNVASSLYHQSEKLTGEKMTKYYLDLNGWQMPIWGFKNIPYEAVLEESEKRPLHLLKWELPISIHERTIYDTESLEQIRTEEEAKNDAIDHVKNDLKTKLGPDAEIIKYYVLHETVDSGKVKLNLYISVLENIATGKKIQ